MTPVETAPAPVSVPTPNAPTPPADAPKAPKFQGSRQVPTYAADIASGLAKALDEKPKHVYGAAMIAFNEKTTAEQMTLVNQAKLVQAEFIKAGLAPAE